MDRISNQFVEVQFDAKGVAWRPAHDPADTREDRDKADRRNVTASEVLRGLMGLTDALPPKWAAVADEEIAAGGVMKHSPDKNGWRWIVAPK